MDYANAETLSMHPKLGSATLPKLAFPKENNPNFPRDKSQWDITLLYKNKTKKSRMASLSLQVTNGHLFCTKNKEKG